MKRTIRKPRIHPWRLDWCLIGLSIKNDDDDVIGNLSSLSRMLVLSVLALVFVLPTVLTGRIPLFDGAIDGVGSSDLSEVKTLVKGAIDADATARTPGKLRVVENSGVCGECDSV